MYDTILVGADGSVNANRAIVRALENSELATNSIEGVEQECLDGIGAELIVLGYQGQLHTIGSATDPVVRTSRRATLVV